MEINKTEGTNETKKVDLTKKENKSLVADNKAGTTVTETKTEIKDQKENKPEDKKEEKKSIATNQTENEKAKSIIMGLVNGNKALKIADSASKTGTSFFSGRKRLCKLLNTKRGVAIEINVKLSPELAKLEGMETISATVAYKKHLGTMKHLYRASDIKSVAAIMKDAVAVFKAELEAEKKAEETVTTEEKKVVNS